MKKIINLLFVVAVCALSFSACAQKSDYPVPPKYIPLPSGEFPIIAGGAFYQPFINDNQFEWVKEAGFNTIGQLLSVQDTDSLLKLARKHDVYVMARPYSITDTTNLKNGAIRYKDNPYVWGYALADEPNVSKFPFLNRLHKRTLEVAPNQNCYFNLLPAVGAKQLGAKDYRTYVDEFVREVNPAYLSFDIYPVKVNGKGEIYVDKALYPTLETIAEVARESGRPFFSYILSNKHWSYPKPKREYMRFEAFTALGYGAQGLKYFTYLMPDFDKGKGEFSDAPIDWNGKRTEVWYMVRDVNKEIQNLAKVFLGAEVLSVTHTGKEIPEGTTRLWTLPEPFRIIESDGEGVMVSHLRNGDHEYLMLVNRDVVRKQKVRLSRTRPVMRLYGDGSEKLEKSASLTLTPGGYAIYRLN